MKFDFVIGNPPYQEDQDGDNNFSPSVYNYYMDESYKVATAAELIHPARFLFHAGNTPEVWNKKMLNDEHFKILFFTQNSGEIFKNTDIKGGVVISYRDSTKNFGAIHVFLHHPELNRIREKIVSKSTLGAFKNIIHLQNRYNLKILLSEHPECQSEISSNGKDKRLRSNAFERVSLFSESKINEDDIKIIGRIDSNRCYRYLPIKYIDLNHKNLDKWKVLVPSSSGEGKLGEVLTDPFVGEPGLGYTDTFLGIGAFDTKEEANNALKYIKTKFCRVLLGILKITVSCTRDTWEYVTLENFTPESDINWNTSIAEIDKQLYRKYGLEEDEISFIEENVKEMV